jgi:hypothetical protein
VSSKRRPRKNQTALLCFRTLVVGKRMIEKISYRTHHAKPEDRCIHARTQRLTAAPLSGRHVAWGCRSCSCSNITP